MKIDFNLIAETAMPNFKGGEGVTRMRTQNDGLNKIMYGRLDVGCTIGYHTHDGNSEIIYITRGTARCLYDGGEELLAPGQCHYCPRGHSHGLINASDSEPLEYFAVVAEQPATPDISHRITPSHITHLKPGQVFVFGSNGMGAHGGGAARAAVMHFGAIMGQAEGLQGNSYAINSMDGLDVLRQQAERFVIFAKEHPERTFLVTPIGCGIAGYRPAQVAPLFAAATQVENIWLPQEFWDVLA